MHHLGRRGESRRNASLFRALGHTFGLWRQETTREHAASRRTRGRRVPWLSSQEETNRSGGPDRAQLQARNIRRHLGLANPRSADTAPKNAETDAQPLESYGLGAVVTGTSLALRSAARSRRSPRQISEASPAPLHLARRSVRSRSTWCSSGRRCEAAAPWRATRGRFQGSSGSAMASSGSTSSGTSTCTASSERGCGSANAGEAARGSCRRSRWGLVAETLARR